MTPGPPPPQPVNPERWSSDDSVSAADDLASIDAADSEIVLRRAIELSGENVVVAQRMPVATLEEVAAELDFPASAVADALAEYRAGALVRNPESAGGGTELVEPRRTILDRLIGPGTVTVRHRTGLPEGDVAESLGRWLKRGHRLRVRINREGAVVGVRRRGVVPSMARSVRSATGTAGLAGVKEVRAAAVGAEEGSTSLCLVADVTDARTQSVVAGSTVAVGGAVVVSAAAVVAGPVTLAGVPVAVGIGWVTSRLTHRRRVRRIAEEVEMTADNVAAGASPPTITDEIVDRLTPRRRPRT